MRRKDRPVYGDGPVWVPAFCGSSIISGWESVYVHTLLGDIAELNELR